MRYLLGPGFSCIAGVALFVILVAQASDSEPPREVTITVADGVNCLVNETKVHCPDVLNQLRNFQRLPAGSRVHLLVAKTSTYESTAKVIELLQRSEYKLKMGYMNVRASPND